MDAEACVIVRCHKCEISYWASESWQGIGRKSLSRVSYCGICFFHDPLTYILFALSSCKQEIHWNTNMSSSEETQTCPDLEKQNAKVRGWIKRILHLMHAIAINRRLLFSPVVDLTPTVWPLHCERLHDNDNNYSPNNNSLGTRHPRVFTRTALIQRIRCWERDRPSKELVQVSRSCRRFVSMSILISLIARESEHTKLTTIFCVVKYFLEPVDFYLRKNAEKKKAQEKEHETKVGLYKNNLFKSAFWILPSHPQGIKYIDTDLSSNW